MADDAAAPAVLELTQALIARRSLTPDDAGCCALIGERLAALGFSLEWMNCEGVTNLWATLGSGGPLFVLAGHTDVVPTGPVEHWSSPPFEAVEREGMLYGRGAADMKSSIAAFTVAAEQFVALHPAHQGSIALLLTSDEEGPSVDGTVAVVEALQARGEAIDYCLVGEPTSVERLGDTLKNGRRGSLSARVRVRGIQGHVAYPQLARNPIHELAPALEELVATRWDAGTANFQPTSLQLTGIQAGTGAGNVIPGTCELTFNLRFSPASTPEGLRSRIESILFSHELEFEVEWTVGALPFECAAGRLMQAVGDAVQEVVGHRPTASTTGGTSDGRFIARVCREVVELGPLNASIHKVDECIPAGDVETLKDIYLRALERLLPGQA